MKTFVTALTLVALLVKIAPAQSRPTDSIGWLTGCWEWRTPSRVVEEQWSSTTGGTLLGFSKTTVRDSLREYEFIRIDAAGDALIYHAQPVRQAPAQFRALPPFDSVLTFTNPQHDFPQRVIYRRLGPDTIRARVEGTRNGQTRGFDYPYVRVKC